MAASHATPPSTTPPMAWCSCAAAEAACSGAGVSHGAADGGAPGQGGGRILRAHRRRLPAAALRRRRGLHPGHRPTSTACSSCSSEPTGSKVLWGRYRSNPGFYGRPSNHDAVFHEGFEELNPRAILVVVDPIKSATGNFTMNAFRSVTSYHETSSNVGALNREFYSLSEVEKPFFELDIFAQGLASMFYSILISHRNNDLEIKYFERMGRKGSSGEDYCSLCRFPDMSESEKKNVEEMLTDLLFYQNEEEMQESDVPENPPEAENHLEELKNLMSPCILQIFGMMLAWSSF